MQVSRWIVAGSGAALLCTPSFGTERVQGPAASGKVADAILDAVVETSGVPGMASAVVDRGRLIWAGTAGVRDMERGLPVVPDTAFRLASVSKLITATAAMRLYEQGRLDIDAPASTFVDYLDPRWSAMTPRQLAANTSGIPHYQEVDAKRGDRRLSSVREAIALFNGRDLLFTPGERYSYSSWGFTLLSGAVEAAAGVPFLDYVARDVVGGLAIRPDTDPAGAVDTVAYVLEGGTPARAPAHDYSYSWGGAGFRSTAPALASFGDRVMSPGFLQPRTREEMWTPATTSDGKPVADRDFQVGFGWRIGQSVDGERIVHHAGVALGARSALVAYPETRLTVSLLSNASWTSSIERTAETIAAPFRDRERAQDDTAPCPVGTTRYEGDFADGAIAGSATFRLEDGLCRGSISTANALGAWLNGFPTKDASALPVISLRADGSLDRAALVTPIGAYQLRRDDHGSLLADFGGSRRLRIKLAQPGGQQAARR